MNYNIDDLLKNKVELDDKLEFTCNQCGNCCRNKEEIIITGFDLFRIARRLGLTTEQVLNKYAFGYIGDTSRLPIVSLKPKAFDKSCPFLRKGICILGSEKPVSCTIYPMGRFYDNRTDEYIYFNQKEISCVKKRAKLTLREWIEDINKEEVIRATKEWGNALIDLALYVKDIKDNIKQKAATQAILIALYFNYDTKNDYIEELRKNMKILEDTLPGFRVKN